MAQVRLQRNALHGFLAVFFVLMAIYYPRLERFEDYALYIATALFSLHLWYGGIFFLENLGPAASVLELAVDVSILALKVASIYVIPRMVAWFLVNGVLMGLCVVKYRRASGREQAAGKEAYVSRKTAIETMSVFTFLLLAILVWIVDTDLLRKALAVIVVGVQAIASGWMVLGGKVYRVPA
jgi:heme/copper-type cytochrome/quinol oxidase subunit 2